MGFRFWKRGGKARLRLRQSLGAFAAPGEDISPLYVFFEVENAGGEEARISRVMVAARGGERLHLGDGLEGERLPPFALGPGESARLSVRAKDLAQRLADAGYEGRPRVRLVVEDGAGEAHERSFRFRVGEYLELKDE